jgi:predicted dehydrogenase
MAAIRWGIVGCGDVADKKGGPALRQAAGSRLVAVTARDPAKTAGFARRHDVSRFYTDVASLLADAEVDAVYVATPPHLHREQTVRAAAAGKHVLVEKPMALDAAECDAMIAACRAAGVRLHVAYYRRFWPKFRAVKGLLDAGQVGEVVGARLQMCAPPVRVGSAAAVPWRLRPEISGGGLFVDVGSHRIDLLRFLLGDVAAVAGHAANHGRVSNAEDNVVFALRFVSGALATGSFHFSAGAPPRDVLEIYGTDGAIVCDPFDGEAFTVVGGGDPGAYRQPAPFPTHLPLVQALAEAWRDGNGEVPEVAGPEGAETTRVIDAVLNDYRAESAAKKSSASSTAT